MWLKWRDFNYKCNQEKNPGIKVPDPQLTDSPFSQFWLSPRKLAYFEEEALRPFNMGLPVVSQSCLSGRAWWMHGWMEYVQSLQLLAEESHLGQIRSDLSFLTSMMQNTGGRSDLQTRAF